MSLHVAAVDLYDPVQAAIWLDLLDHYARDPMGGGEGLSDYAKLNLVHTIRQVPGFHGALAWLDGEAVGLIDCFAGFSTFAAKPLLNVHDIVVHASRRGQGIAQALLAWAGQRAGELGCCKLTLEVLEGNLGARRAYLEFGFEGYQLDPAMGQALFMEKKLG